jgi:hypothetical protein
VQYSVDQSLVNPALLILQRYPAQEFYFTLAPRRLKCYVLVAALTESFRLMWFASTDPFRLVLAALLDPQLVLIA